MTSKIIHFVIVVGLFFILFQIAPLMEKGNLHALWFGIAVLIAMLFVMLDYETKKVMPDA